MFIFLCCKLMCFIALIRLNRALLDSDMHLFLGIVMTKNDINKYLKLSKVATIFLLASLPISCDYVPELVDKGSNMVSRKYYEYNSADMEIADLYNAGKSNCCDKDSIHDEISALNYFCDAAKDGHAASLFEVGKIYYHIKVDNATIIPKDRSLAFTFFSLAEQRDFDQAAYYRTKILEEMDSKEFERATRLIESYPRIPCEITE